MKSTGVVRRVDELGRIVIPIELRRTLDIAEKDALEIYVDGEQIIYLEHTNFREFIPLNSLTKQQKSVLPLRTLFCYIKKLNYCFSFFIMLIFFKSRQL